MSEEVDIESATEIIENHPRRLRVRHTDEGQTMVREISQLQDLLDAYRAGLIKERS